MQNVERQMAERVDRLDRPAQGVVEHPVVIAVLAHRAVIDAAMGIEEIGPVDPDGFALVVVFHATLHPPALKGWQFNRLAIGAGCEAVLGCSDKGIARRHELFVLQLAAEAVEVSDDHLNQLQWIIGVAVGNKPEAMHRLPRGGVDDPEQCLLAGRAFLRWFSQRSAEARM